MVVQIYISIDDDAFISWRTLSGAEIVELLYPERRQERPLITVALKIIANVVSFSERIELYLA